MVGSQAPAARLEIRPVAGWRPVRRRVAWIGIAAAAYYAAAHVGYAFGFSGSVAAIVWLPAGVGVAFLYLGGLSLWPGLLIGDLLVNDYSLPIGSAIGQTCGN